VDKYLKICTSCNMPRCSDMRVHALTHKHHTRTHTYTYTVIIPTSIHHAPSCTPPPPPPPPPPHPPPPPPPHPPPPPPLPLFPLPNKHHSRPSSREERATSILLDKHGRTTDSLWRTHALSLRITSPDHNRPKTLASSTSLNRRLACVCAPSQVRVQKNLKSQLFFDVGNQMASLPL